MIQFLQNRREKRTDNAVIVFEPVKVRAGAMWRAVKIARAALLVWGGVSLAGAAVAAIGYGRGGLEPYLQAAAEAPASKAVAVVQPSARLSRSRGQRPFRQNLPQSAEQPAIAAAVTPRKAVKPAPVAPANPDACCGTRRIAARVPRICIRRIWPDQERACRPGAAAYAL
jgi:hypothetical protein